MDHPKTLPLTHALRHMIELAAYTLDHPSIQIAPGADLDTSEVRSDDLMTVAAYLGQSGDELQVAADRLRDIAAYLEQSGDELQVAADRLRDTVDAHTVGGAA